VVGVSRDWAIASDVQQRFMQGWDRPVGTLDYSARCRQVCELGGDCYDFAPLPDNRLALAVSDASGKSLAAALMIANVQLALRMAALFTGHDGPRMLRAVNRQVYASSLANLYAVFYGVFDRTSGTLRLRQRRAQTPDVHSVGRLDHVPGGRRPACGNVSELNV
jgi:sigma-B regulation protein RsbU (phosphoserine phosphatase)